MTIRHLIPALALLAVVAGLSQTPPAAKPVVKKAAPVTAHVRDRAGTPAETDAQLEKAIRARFADSKIAEDKFEVHVQGGRATITGNTNVLQHKGVATRLAKAQGVTAVVNNVEPSEQARQKAAANLATGRRRAQIKRGDARSEQR